MYNAVNGSPLWIRLLKGILISLVVVIFLFMLIFFIISYRIVGSLSGDKKVSVAVAQTTTKVPGSQVGYNLSASDAKPLVKSQVSLEKDKETKTSNVSFLSSLEKLGELESIRQEMDLKPVHDMCEILCKESYFKYDKEAGENPIEYLTTFYATYGNRSFEDPKFRLVMEMGLAYFTYFTPSVRKMIVEIEDYRKNGDEISGMDQAIFAARIQTAIIESLYYLKDNQTAKQDRLHRVKEMSTLQKLCDKESHNEILRKCQETIHNF